MLQGFGVTDGSLTKQFLKFPTVVERTLHLRDQFVGNVDRQSTPFDSDIEDVTGVPFTFHAGFTVFTDTRAPTQAERADSRRPKTGSLILEPLLDFCRGFFRSSHTVRMTHSLRTVNKILTCDVVSTRYEFRDRNYLGDAMSSQSNEVELIRVPGGINAESIMLALRGRGIPARAQGEIVGAIYGLTLDGLGERSIFVPEEYLEEARSILDAGEHGDLIVGDNCAVDGEESDET
jgi:hypothetical protein